MARRNFSGLTHLDEPVISPCLRCPLFPVGILPAQTANLRCNFENINYTGALNSSTAYVILRNLVLSVLCSTQYCGVLQVSTLFARQFKRHGCTLTAIAGPTVGVLGTGPRRHLVYTCPHGSIPRFGRIGRSSCKCNYALNTGR